MLNFKSDRILIAATASNAGGPTIASFASLVAFSVNTQFWLHFKISSISALINKMSKLNIKLLRLFNGTTILTSSN